MRSPAFAAIMVFLVLASAAGCSRSNLRWSREDFAKWQKKESPGAFKFRFMQYEVNMLTTLCAYYFSSRLYVDELPIRRIADLYEKKYRVRIDTSYFEQAVRIKSLNTVTDLRSITDDEKQKRNYRGYILSRDNNVVGRLSGNLLWTYYFNHAYIAHTFKANWEYFMWSEDLRFGFYGFDLDGTRGKTNQLQVLYNLNSFGFYLTVRLCVLKGNRDKDGFYELDIVAEHKVRLGDSPDSCKPIDYKKIAAALQLAPELLKKEMK